MPIDSANPAWANRRHEQQVHHLREHQHDDRDPDRRADVLAGVEAGREHLHPDEADQPDAVAHQRKAVWRDVAGAEGTVLEQRATSGVGKTSKATAHGSASSSVSRRPQSSMPD